MIFLMVLMQFAQPFITLKNISAPDDWKNGSEFRKQAETWKKRRTKHIVYCFRCKSVDLRQPLKHLPQNKLYVWVKQNIEWNKRNLWWKHLQKLIPPDWSLLSKKNPLTMQCERTYITHSCKPKHAANFLRLIGWIFSLTFGKKHHFGLSEFYS